MNIFIIAITVSMIVSCSSADFTGTGLSKKNNQNQGNGNPTGQFGDNSGSFSEDMNTGSEDYLEKQSEVEGQSKDQDLISGNGSEQNCSDDLNKGVINFEKFPDGSTPVDKMKIGTQFEKSHNVTFKLENNNLPQIAMAGAPNTAFNGPSGPDTVVEAKFGSIFLTDDSSPGSSQPLIISYSKPVKAASGYILDLDGSEGWTIEAKDQSGQIIDTVLLDSPGFYTYDGKGVQWAFEGDEDIYSIRLAPKTIGGNFGLAFDLFSPAKICP